MKKIYTDSNLSNLFDCNCRPIQFESIDDVPDDCDLVAYSVFNCSNFVDIAAGLLAKSKFVLIDFNELTCPKSFDAANKLMCRHNNLKVISTIVPNCHSRIEFSGHWFMSPINFYSANTCSSWALDCLSKLIPVVDTRSSLADCFLGRSGSHKDLIEKLYQASPQRDKIIFSYYKNNIGQGIWDFPIGSIKDSGQMVQYQGAEFTASSFIPHSIYNQSYYSVVAETLDINNYSFYTEKIAKPILAKRPFVVFSGQHYLKNLKKLGFRTFDNVIDESYDSITDINKRFNLAWQQIEHLLLQDPMQIYQLTQSTREHNYQLFRSTDWTANSKRIISNFFN